MNILYFAPINCMGNYCYRHLLLKHKADFVFSELIIIENIEKEIRNNKLKIFTEDISRTIFQIGVSNIDEVKEGIKVLSDKISGIKEININMGCPQSSMKNKKLCAGILFDKEHTKTICECLVQECKKKKIIPSIKVRLGLDINKIEINDYIKIAEDVGVEKIYIHLRPLKYNYEKSALFNELNNIKHKNIQIIINGDIDSYYTCEKINNIINNDGLMIGRAALINPLIFEQIKNKNNVDFEYYSPILNDPNIIRKEKKSEMNHVKKYIILDFLKICIEENLRKQVVRSNLNYLLKGVSSSRELLREINMTKKDLIDWIGILDVL